MNQDISKQIVADFRAKNPVWREVSEEDYDDMLCDQPPIYGCQGFLSPEAFAYNEKDEKVYYGFKEAGGRFWCRICTIEEFKEFFTVPETEWKPVTEDAYLRVEQGMHLSIKEIENYIVSLPPSKNTEGGDVYLVLKKEAGKYYARRDTTSGLLEEFKQKFPDIYKLLTNK